MRATKPWVKWQKLSNIAKSITLFWIFPIIGVLIRRKKNFLTLITSGQLPFLKIYLIFRPSILIIATSTSKISQGKRKSFMLTLSWRRKVVIRQPSYLSTNLCCLMRFWKFTLMDYIHIVLCRHIPYLLDNVTWVVSLIIPSIAKLTNFPTKALNEDNTPSRDLSLSRIYTALLKRSPMSSSSSFDLRIYQFHQKCLR